MPLYKMRPSQLTYNVLIKMCSDRGHLDSAFRFFDEMKKNGNTQPDYTTYQYMIDMCLESNAEKKAEKIFNEAQESGVKITKKVYASRLLFFAKQEKKLDKAFAIFKEGSLNDVGFHPGAITQFIETLSRQNYPKFRVFLNENRVPNRIPSLKMYQGIIQGLLNLKMVEEAAEIYAEMKQEGLKLYKPIQKKLVESCRKRKIKLVDDV